MTIGAHLETYAGRVVVDFEPGDALPDPAHKAVRLAITYDGEIGNFTELMGEFLSTPGVEQTQALVVGNWSNPEDGPSPSEPAVEALVASAGKLPNLKALFFGDITSEENEISWIEQSDVAAFWGAFPQLETFGIRGGNMLHLGRIRHARLKSLIVEAGGLPRGVVHAIAAADLPELEHLEIWLGTPQYNGDSRPEDLAGILDGSRFPKLQSLALRNCEWADELAAVVATAPILKRIKRLDLSMGTLSDIGVDALIASPAVRNLTHLDIHRHYVSEATVARLKTFGVEVNAEDRQKPEVYQGVEQRYVAVSE